MKLDKVLGTVLGGDGLSEELSGEMTFELRPQRIQRELELSDFVNKNIGYSAKFEFHINYKCMYYLGHTYTKNYS